MNESVQVIFPDDRTVFVDGAKCGETNQIFTVETGTHTFTLGSPVDYTPASITAKVTGTSSLAPKILTFQLMASGVE